MIRPISRRRLAAASSALAVAALFLTACAGGTGSEASDESADGGLETVTAGKLTIATGEPAFEPWVIGDAPESGEGFEAAVAYAVAEELGYSKDDVVWVRSTFESAIAPGAKDWDLNIQQFSVTEERKQAVDFSSPYYTTTQAVVTVGDSAAADAASLADLQDLAIGVAAGTTSYTIAADEFGADKLSVFNSNDDVVAALQSGQIDALVVDLPTAFYLSAAVLDDGVVVGQLGDSTGGDELAFVLPKDSSLTASVTEAVDALTEDGTLDALETEWLSESVDVPVLQ